MTSQEQVTALIKAGNYDDSTDSAIAHVIVANINSGKIVPGIVTELRSCVEAAWLNADASLAQENDRQKQRAESAEAKLAKAVELLRDISNMERFECIGDDRLDRIDDFLAKENQPADGSHAQNTDPTPPGAVTP